MVPQHRERINITGFERQRYEREITFDFLLVSQKNETHLRDILQQNPDLKYTLSDKLWSRLQDYAAKQKSRNGFGYSIADLNGISRTLSVRYYKDGSEILINQEGKNPRMLTPRECARLMGFPETFIIPVSDTQAYHQFGNSVIVPLIEKLAELIIEEITYLERVSKINHKSNSSNAE